jgi:hypothetical protein
MKNRIVLQPASQRAQTISYNNIDECSRQIKEDA